MKQLIVNADDYNTDEARNRGILDAARRGIVTSTSVLANVGWPHGALDGLKEVFPAAAGVHLNLTKGIPLCHDLRSLVGSCGFFLSKPIAWRTALRRGFDQREIEREFAAQIRALQSAGIVPDHIDGNNHMHVFPGAVHAAVRAARDCGITRVRLPLEPLCWSLVRPGRGMVKKCLLTLLSLRARAVFANAGLSFPDRCAGLHVPDVHSESDLIRFLRRMEPGCTELMCHPGFAAAGNDFSTAERERELSALTANGVLEAVKINKITLISFSQMPCA
jgi:chitin disaccharide deacetylase